MPITQRQPSWTGRVVYYVSNNREHIFQGTVESEHKDTLYIVSQAEYINEKLVPCPPTVKAMRTTDKVWTTLTALAIHMRSGQWFN